MASDSAKTQLLSIYKLEFYKNKKNWKLYEDVRKEPPPSPITPHKLNKTYNVGEEFLKPMSDEELVSPHNKAFLHEESDDTPDPQPPDSEPPSPAVADHNLYRPRSWPGQSCSGDRPVPVWQEAQQDWCGAEAEGVAEELAYDQCDGPWQRDLWAPASELSLKPAVDPLDMHTDYLSPAKMLATAEEWLLLHGYPLLQQEYASSYEEYGLLDETADFVRGAHQVPHSSEIDLSIIKECPCVCKDTVCALSTRQIARAVQRHHAALALLLQEQALRDRLTALSRALPPLPFEECPTRDTDPLRPPDAVLAASHGPPQPHGPPHGPLQGPPYETRGRGRLLQARQLLGVGPGRPYQL